MSTRPGYGVEVDSFGPCLQCPSKKLELHDVLEIPCGCCDLSLGIDSRLDEMRVM